MSHRIAFATPFDIGRPRAPLPAPAGAVRVAPPGRAGDLAYAAAVCAALADEIAATSGEVLAVMGDCLTSLGVLAGLQRKGVRPRVVWVDAHGDFNTPETSVSGYVGGMPLAIVVGRAEPTLAAELGITAVPETDVALVGARDLDTAEAEALAGSDVTVAGLAELPRLLAGDRPVWLHVDLDILDPGSVPALQFPASGGPGPVAFRRLLSEAADGATLAAVSFACTWEDEAPGATEAAEVMRSLIASIA